MTPPLALAIALLLAAVPDPSSLVAKLGSSQSKERDEAAASLKALGLEAVPALRAASRSKEAALRERAAQLLDSIESELLIKPTLIALDYQDRPVEEVVKSIAARSGFRLALEPPNDPTWQTLQVTLRESRPLSFWEALERLGAAGQLRHHPGVPPGPDDRVPVLHLISGSNEFPRSFSGPFRVNLLSVHRGRDLVFGPPGEAEADEAAESIPERFELTAQVFAEPRLLIGLNGPPQQLLARDNFDQDLAPPPPEPDEDMPGPEADAPAPKVEPGPGFSPGALSIVQFPIGLRAPERPGTTIDRLEGFLPLQVALRLPSPLTVKLTEAAGRTFAAETATLRFAARVVDPSGRSSLELFVRTRGETAPPSENDEPLPPGFPEPRRVDTLQNRVEIVDPAGRPLAWSVKVSETLEAGEVRVVLALSTRNGKAVPAQLRYYELSQGAVEVPFKFTKIPIP